MTRIWLFASIFLFLATLGQAQQPPAGAAVPRLMKFGGTLQDPAGQPLTGVVGVTFAIYATQQGGASLWMETQNLSLDAQGNYSALLGSTTTDGLPVDLFTSGEPRWLGVQAQGQDEQPRVLLVSVPYALKAADADTLGGLPVSAFALAQPQGPSNSSPSSASISTAGLDSPQRVFSRLGTVGGSGTLNYLAKWDPTGLNLLNSGIFESGGNVGIGTTDPSFGGKIGSRFSLSTADGSTAFVIGNATTPRMAINGETNGSFALYDYASGNWSRGINQTRGTVGIGISDPTFGGLVASRFSLAQADGSPGFVVGNATMPRFAVGGNSNGSFTLYDYGAGHWTVGIVQNSGKIGIGTTAPAYALDVEGGQINASGGLCIAGTCKTSWPTGGGSGTVTSVAAGAGLIASPGPITSTGTISVANGGITSTMLASGTIVDSNISNSAAISVSKINGAATLGANIFAGTQTISSGVLALPNTAASAGAPTAGVITLGGIPFIHNYPPGYSNLFVGQYAGNFSMTGSGGNTALGDGNLNLDTSGFNNTAIGSAALAANTSGSGNTATGFVALGNNTTGGFNTALGSAAMGGNTTGAFNTAVGSSALGGNSTGASNTATGNSALNYNTTGDRNTATGATALYNNATGAGNTAMGFQSLEENTVGNSNSAFGENALIYTLGSNNTASGFGALSSNTTGSNNTALGYQAGSGVGNLTNATAIGANAQVSADNSLVLGSINGVNGATSNVNVGIGTTAPAYVLDVQGGQINASGGLCIAGTCQTSWPSGGVVGAANLTGTTLASNVVASSLTSVGTLTNLTVTNPINGSITGSAASAATAGSAGNVTGVVGIANGGTGNGATVTAHNFFGNNTSATGAPAYGPIGTSDVSPNWYVAAGGTAQAQTAALSPAVPALVAGLEVNFLPSAANSAPGPTLNVNGLGAIPITKYGTAPVAANDLNATAVAKVIYDGTEWQLQNPQSSDPIGAVSLPTPGTLITLTAPSGFAICTEACIVTLPPPQPGFQFCIRNDDNVSSIITLAGIPGAMYEFTSLTGYGSPGGPATSSGAIGDAICLLGRDATHYLVFLYTGTWTMF